MFGAEARLAGVVSEPDDDGTGAIRPAVIVWNAGLLHHVGPHRLFVDLCRQLAGAGFPALRFDLGGIGDSTPAGGTLPAEERAIAEIREAMDFLAATRAAQRFVLVGLCSGAVDAHHVAVADERVCGAVMLDGYGYRTPGFYLRHYRSRLLNPAGWVRRAHRLASVWPVGASGSSTANEAVQKLNYRRFPPRHQVCRELQRLIARDVDLLYVYSGGVDGYYNHLGQFRRMLPGVRSGSHLQVAYVPEADHLQTLLETREKLVRLVCDWTTAKFAGRAAG